MIKNPRYSYWINGREVVQSCVARPLVIDGNVVGAYSVQHDLTEIKQIVEENILLQQEAEHHRIRKRDIGSPLYDMSALIGKARFLPNAVKRHGKPPKMILR